VPFFNGQGSAAQIWREMVWLLHILGFRDLAREGLGSQEVGDFAK
jgi:hypothetical protein